MYINLNLYRIFDIVAKSKSYSDAANEANISVPAISKSINQLENVLDAKLFYRESRGVKLTKIGKDMFKYIDKALADIDFAEKMLLKYNDLDNGEIIIGCPSHITKYYLLQYIEEAKNDYPGLKIKIVSGESINELLTLLENHKVDFIIDSAHFDATYNNLKIDEIKTIENILVSSKEITIKNLKDLEQFNFILGFEYTTTTKKLIKKLKENDISIKANMEIDITELRVEMAKRNLGIAYVMKEAVKEELENNELYEVKLPIKLPTSTINLIYIKDQLPKIDCKFIKKYLYK